MGKFNEYCKYNFNHNASRRCNTLHDCIVWNPGRRLVATASKYPLPPRDYIVAFNKGRKRQEYEYHVKIEAAKEGFTL
jgi:hypothetical protein